MISPSFSAAAVCRNTPHAGRTNGVLGRAQAAPLSTPIGGAPQKPVRNARQPFSVFSNPIEPDSDLVPPGSMIGAPMH